MRFLCSMAECANAAADCCAEKEMKAKPPTQVSDFPNAEEKRIRKAAKTYRRQM